MTTGRINQVTIPTLGSQPNSWKPSPTANHIHQMCRIHHQGVRHQTMRIPLLKENSHHRKKPIEITWTSPHRTPIPPLHLHGLTRNPSIGGREKGAISRPSLLSPRTHNLGYRISQSTKGLKSPT